LSTVSSAGEASLSRREAGVRFALDSSVEGVGFEPSVPRKMGSRFQCPVLGGRAKPSGRLTRQRRENRGAVRGSQARARVPARSGIVALDCALDGVRPRGDVVHDALCRVRVKERVQKADRNGSKSVSFTSSRTEGAPSVAVAVIVIALEKIRRTHRARSQRTRHHDPAAAALRSFLEKSCCEPSSMTTRSAPETTRATCGS